jgi:aspartate carbamoyltransferase catalytic subunit
MTVTTSSHKDSHMKINPLYLRDFITSKNLSLAEVELILQTAQQFKKNTLPFTIQHKIIASCFFEPSTRTRLSFETAALRLGGNVIGFSSTEGLSLQKGETLSDTIQMISNCADLIIIRHPAEGSAKLAAEIADCPVINAGDGSNQHPSQALLDIFTIQESQKELNGLSIAIVGDLKNGRTVHSLIDICSLFDIRFYFIAPELLSLPDALCDELKQRGARFSFHQSLEEIIPKVDIIYMTRIQKERFPTSGLIFEKSPFALSVDMLHHAKPNMKILHPLPRVDEISKDIDKTPYAYYFQQAANGIPIRQALLTLLLNEQHS